MRYDSDFGHFSIGCGIELSTSSLRYPIVTTVFASLYSTRHLFYHASIASSTIR